MDILQAVVLGIIQGITEWLPISSSAHLAIAQHIMGLEIPVAFDIMLHFGTLMAVIACYRREIISMAKNITANENKSYIICLICTTAITGIIGIAVKDFFESMFSNLFMVGIALMITGVWLLVVGRMKTSANGNISVKDALAIGLAQGIAVAPGISRSGATIGTGIALGIEPKAAAKYSFLAAIPAIIGATVIEGRTIFSTSMAINPIAILAGTLVSAIVGYFSIGLLVSLLEQGKFALFGYYCLAVGLTVAFLSR